MDQLLPAEIVEAGGAFPGALAACGDLDALLRLKGAYVGREGSHAARLMELLKVAPKEQKRDLGAAINALKQQWEEGLKVRQAELEAAKKNLNARASQWDPTLPPPVPAQGALHPLNRLMDRLVDVFRPLGFHVEEGPEVENEAHNFDGLNIPEDHPAKASSDTFYFAEHPELLLRTHTSPVQVRTLLRVAPTLAERGGIRFLAPGRVYRKDEIDPTHSPMFHQVEGMLVGHNIGMQHLKGTLEYALRALFGPHTEIRLRPSYFPFVEPGCEVDLSCPLCGAKGCRVCKGSGWVEILGAGLIHPNVLSYAGIDPAEWSGWAFGMGVERMSMMLSQTPDLRLFFENDQRFLKVMGGLD
ncbi:phenylalanine--tRNA ligase subunit alpha [Geothrix sp. PMB-07]|uniref:phenylalanine--tRNA ligase subunit alpha n=1 Tax=Geothrix sp. PMB-07 TaxID=3068640 RepID=UPI00274238D0|nr:phenylalanine--tRNA ligase subunit alpha [Geothrix sp. PMB-07]WLT31536.1 phenylalanine--tRNA ligase subunit alpha [Geothrix sp. PMB-07]